MTTTQTVSRERLEDLKRRISMWGHGAGYTPEEVYALIENALAEMDSEPYGYVHQAIYEAQGSSGLSNDHEAHRDSDSHIPVYSHAAPPAPVAYPERLPCPVLLEPGLRIGKGVKTSVLLNALQRRAAFHAELDAMTPEQRAEHYAGVNEMREMLGVPPLPAPAPVTVPDELPEFAPDDVLKKYFNWTDDGDAEVFSMGWNACRAAMLKAEPDEIGSWVNGRFTPTHEPLTTATVPDGWKLVPVEPTEAMLGDDDDDAYRAITLKDIWSAMLAAAPAAPEQEV